MLKTGIAFVALFLGTAVCATSASAEGFYICKGEVAQRCRGMASDVTWFGCCDGCNAPENDVANRVCQEANGTGVRSLVHIKTEDGNKCGYNLWKVFCEP